jgi:2-oxopent-4-enoate/cis-2-oxohex-4-enoate hydratase
MEKQVIENLGDALYAAWTEKRTIQPLIETHPEIKIEDAYKIQERYIARRLQAGESIIGKKIGVTSKPVQDFLGVFEPDFGQLTSGMLFTEAQGIKTSTLIQPKAEAELAFVLKKDLVGPGITATDVLAATDYVVPCFEVVDSRITDWKIKIQDTVADNASCGVFVLGQDKVEPRKVDLSLAGMAVYRNGELHSTSVGAAVQGSPVNAVVWLANTLGRLGLPFRAGEIILSGSQSALIPVVAGDELKCTIGGVGSCVARFHGGL